MLSQTAVVSPQLEWHYVILYCANISHSVLAASQSAPLQLCHSAAKPAACPSPQISVTLLSGWDPLNTKAPIPSSVTLIQVSLF